MTRKMKMIISKRTNKYKSQEKFKPMRVKQARIFSIIGLASVAMLFFYIFNNQDMGAIGLVGLVATMFGLGHTGVFRALTKPTDDFDRFPESLFEYLHQLPGRWI